MKCKNSLHIVFVNCWTADIAASAVRRQY